MGRRPLSPSFYAAPRWEPQPGGPGPAKRRRTEAPAGPEGGMAPGPQGPAEPRAADALPSVAVPAAGWVLHLPLDGVDLVLEPEPTSVVQVCVGGHTLVLVPEALWGSAAGARPPGGLGPGAALVAPGGGVAAQQGFFCAFVPEMAVPGEARHEDAAPGFPVPGMVAGTGSGTHRHGPVGEPWHRSPTPSPERRRPDPYDNLSFHLWEPFPSSPLQPLPPSPSPGPRGRPQRPLGPAPKARKRLFRE